MTTLKEAEDALKEIESIGAGNASKVLSEMIKREVNLVVPETRILKKEDIENVVGGPDKLIVCMYTPITGDVSGNAVIALRKNEAFRLIDILEKREIGHTEMLDGHGMNQLENVGRILITPYLEPITEYLKINIQTESIRVISTFGRSVSDFLLMNIQEENILLITTNFSVPGTQIKGDFAFLIAFSSLHKLIEALTNREQHG